MTTSSSKNLYLMSKGSLPGDKQHTVLTELGFVNRVTTKINMFGYIITARMSPAKKIIVRSEYVSITDCIGYFY